MTRVVAAGFLHETNTFAQTPADWENFVNGEGFPRMHRGAELWRLQGVNIPIGGFLGAAADLDVVPAIWAAASPSAPVTDRAFAAISGEIVAACHNAQPDAVYLDLHGAMVTESHDDGDGEVLRLVRRAVGPTTPIVVSLDLHANVSPAMLELADAMVAYRTYPHVDMAATGARSHQQLVALLRGEVLQSASARTNFLIPINSGCTMMDPARELYAMLDRVPDEQVTLTLAAGFPAADVPDCGPTIFGYGPDAGRVRDSVDAVAAAVAAREPEFTLDAVGAAEAIQLARAQITAGIRPVVIADTQDNPGAGGDAKTTTLLAELVAANIPRSAIAALWYPEVVERAAAAGPGHDVDVRFAGTGLPGDQPVELRARVEALTDGRVRFDGPMLHGNELAVGPSCLLRVGNLAIVVNSHKAQVMDRNQVRSAGLTPEDLDLLVVKSSVHFRGDFTAMAKSIIVALAPGPMRADPAELAFTRLRDGLRRTPGPARERTLGPRTRIHD